MSGSYCGKGLLYFYNLIFLGISGVLMYLSVLYVRKWGDYSSLAAGTYAIVPAGIIFVFGILVLVTGVVGLFGTCHENRCTLGVFFILLTILLSLEITAGVLTYQRSDEIEMQLKKNMWNAFHKYDNKYTSSKRSFDKMQAQLECCGVTSPANWRNDSRIIPQSCCIHPSENQCYKLPLNIYTDGCYKNLLKSFHLNLRVIMGVTLAFAVLQLFGLILSVLVIIVLRRRGYTRMANIPKA